MSSPEKKIGRPRKYSSPEEFEEKVSEYRAACIASEEPITWTGLCLYLGFCSRSALDEYLQYPEFSYSVKKAKLMVEMEYEKKLHTGQSTGAIFALKNFNWRDKPKEQLEEEKTNSNVTINIVEDRK
jgi:hypothetical protein